MLVPLEKPDFSVRFAEEADRAALMKVRELLDKALTEMNKAEDIIKYNVLPDYKKAYSPIQGLKCSPQKIIERVSKPLYNLEVATGKIIEEMISDIDTVKKYNDTEK